MQKLIRLTIVEHKNRYSSPVSYTHLDVYKRQTLNTLIIGYTLLSLTLTVSVLLIIIATPISPGQADTCLLYTSPLFAISAYGLHP